MKSLAMRGCVVSAEQCLRFEWPRNRAITFTFQYAIADAKKTIGSVKVKVILSGEVPV